MFDLTTSIAVNAPVDHAFAVLWDVERYPEFLTDVVDVVEDPQPKPNERIVHYTVRAPRLLHYSLHMIATPPHGIAWTLLASDLQRENHGGWQVMATPEGSLLTVRLQMEFRLPVPEVILKKLVEFNLPVMMRQMRARIEHAYRTAG